MTAGYLQARWTPGSDGAATAFLAVLERFSGLVERRLDEVPDKLFLAFLDAMGVSLLPPTPARVPLVFRLAADAPVDVALAEDSTVAAVLPPPLPSSLADRPAGGAGADGPVVFATEGAVSLARARLAALHSVVPGRDAFADHTDRLEAGLTLFDGLEQVPHHLYLGHDRLFDVKGSVEISLQVGVARAAGAAAVTLVWEYHAESGWLPFEPVIDQTKGLTVDGEVLLRKSCGPALAATAVDGVESFWIRARVDDPLPAGPLPRIDTLRVRVSLLQESVPLDVAFVDGLSVDATKDFLAFGRLPEVGSALLIACDEAFRREGVRVGVHVEPSQANPVLSASACRLTWEISTGEGTWLAVKSGDDERFAGSAAQTEWFARPSEWRETTVNGDSHFWLRVRISEAGYGAVQVTAQGVTYPKVPALARVTVSFAYATGPERLDQSRSLNRFRYTDHTDAARFGRDGFEPFRPLPDRQPAIYLGFDAPLPVGLVSLFAEVPLTEEAGAPARSSPFMWEYRSPAGWSDLPLRDGTDGLRARGMVQFVGQPDMVADDGPSAPLYWIRARLKSATSSAAPLPLARLYLNAVWATNRAIVRREIAGLGDGTARQLLTLQNRSVLSDEIVEVQEWRGSTMEWESLFVDVPSERLEFDQDARGRVTGVWVRWEGREHLRRSGPRDRHYTLERTAGVLRFGDGELGLIPPAGAVVRAGYEHGGGAVGNVPAGSVSQLLSAVPYVEAVVNPVAATGGAAAEGSAGVAPPLRRRPGAAGSGVWARGPQQLRHRGRAVSASDVEWLARGASSEIALARCLPTTGPDGVRAPGWIAVVIAPWGGEPEPMPSAELLRRVREHLSASLPAAVASQVRVIGPRYQPVSVMADIAVDDPSIAALVEERLRTGLDRFLHPLHGGLSGAGWDFGEHLPLSQLAAVLERTPGVAFAGELQLTTAGAVAGELVEIARDRLPAAGRHLLKLRSEA